VPIHRGREVTGFAQDDTGVDVELSDGQSVRAPYLVGCDGGRSLIRKAAGIEFPGWDPTMSWLIAQVEMSEEPEWGFRHDALGVHAVSRLEDGGRVGVVLTERQLGTVTRSSRKLKDIKSEAPPIPTSAELLQRKNAEWVELRVLEREWIATQIEAAKAPG
jgi:2-polyprenyl-6-methoxyphenol hydroxylase-like FAD-dependent oxidoreductase